MLHVAGRGWPAGAERSTTPPATARAVALFVIGEMLRLGCQFDLRLLFNKAFADYHSGGTARRSPTGGTS